MFCIPLSLVELPSLKGEGITNCVTQALSTQGFNYEYLASNLVDACSDGASVMLGKHSGVFIRLEEMFPSLFL